jgi:lariat debranching enzyme
MTSSSLGYLNVAVEGCCHGELDRIYSTIIESEREMGIRVDLLLICGDFEAIRNSNDLNHMAVPAKYRHMNTFHEYVTGRRAPVQLIALTLTSFYNL